MIYLHRFFVSLFLTGLITVYLPITRADGMQQSYDSYQQPISSGAQLPNFTNTVNPSYGSEVGAKALNGFGNILTAPLEIPKNIINITNANGSNIFYGLFGGGFKGIVHMTGRLGVGIADLLTFQLPTKPIAQPLYVWDDFDVDTTYGDVFRLQERQEVQQPVVQTPPPPPPAAAPPQPAAEYPAPYSNDTNKKLDTLFKKEMMK